MTNKMHERQLVYQAAQETRKVQLFGLIPEHYDHDMFHRYWFSLFHKVKGTTTLVPGNSHCHSRTPVEYERSTLFIYDHNTEKNLVIEMKGACLHVTLDENRNILVIQLTNSLVMYKINPEQCLISEEIKNQSLRPYKEATLDKIVDIVFADDDQNYFVCKTLTKIFIVSFQWQVVQPASNITFQLLDGHIGAIDFLYYLNVHTVDEKIIVVVGIGRENKNNNCFSLFLTNSSSNLHLYTTQSFESNVINRIAWFPDEQENLIGFSVIDETQKIEKVICQSTIPLSF